MNRKTFVTLWAFAASLAMLLSLLPAVHASDKKSNQGPEIAPPANLTSVTLKSIDGFDVPVSRFDGKVLLIVNTASQSGYTPQYASLEKVYSRYKNRGLEVLAFPTNDFGGEEPGSNAEVRTFATMNYGVSFPIFSKVNLKGPEASPLFAYLTSKDTDPVFGGPIRDSFTKFLVGRDGRVLARFNPGDDPTAPEFTAALENALKQVASAKTVK